jgi:hypothetical protein
MFSLAQEHKLKVFGEKMLTKTFAGIMTKRVSIGTEDHI